MTTIEQEKTYAGITAPLDCPIYRANLERATIADCGICACTHCIQQSNESGKTCTLCNRFIRSHTFTDHATDSPEVFDALFRIKDKEIDRKESTIQEQLKTIEELQSQMQVSWNQLQSCAQLCGEQDAEMKRIWENTIPQLQGRLAELEDQLENSVNCNNVLEDRVNQLQGYAQLCADQDAQLNHIWRNIIPKLQGHQVEMEGQLDESGSGTRLLEEERTGDNIAAPFDCPIYRANLERATIADCGICACTHCIQQCNESGKTCGLCYRFIRSHTFTDHATDSPEVFDALFRIKDKEIDRRGLIIQEQLKTIEELQNLPGQLMTAIVRLEEDVEKVEIYVQRCLEKDTELQNLHENIIPEKDKTIEEQKNDIIYLKGKEKELTELVESLQEENQDVKEKNKELNSKEKELTERVDSLQEGIQNVKEKNKELNRKEKELTELVESLQEEIKHVKEKNIELNDTLTKTEEEAVRLFENLGVYVQLYSEKDTELQYLNGNIIPEKDKLIEDQKNEIINLIGQMEISGKQLQDYEQLRTEQDAQLQHLRENTIPELESRLAELEDVVATFRRETVTVAHFKALPGTSLYTAIQQLQHCYDREYRCRYDITDKLDELLQSRLEDVLTKLLNETSDIGDRLALVIRTYVSLLEENSNLHRSIKTQERTINDMKTELRQTKASKLKMEQRNMSRAEE